MYIPSWIIIIVIVIGIYIYYNKNKGKSTDKKNGEEENNNVMVLEDKDGYYSEVTVYKKDNKYCYYWHSPDYSSENTMIYEYKVDGFDVSVKLLEQRHEHPPGEQYYYVKDGVVLEKDIMESQEFGGIRNTYDKEKRQERIKDLKKLCGKFNKLEMYGIKYFIISLSPEIFPEQGLKTFLRNEMERIKIGLFKVKERCNKNSIELEYDKEIDCYLCISEDRPKIVAFCKSINCEINEIELSERIIKILNGLLKNK